MSTSLTSPVQTEQIHRTRLAIFPSDQPGGKPIVAAVKCTSTGMIKSTLSQVALTEQAGQVYEVQDKLKPTVDGYRHMNTFRGVKIIEPDFLLDEAGKRRPNPYFERDKRGTIKRVTVKKVGIGRDTLGNFAVFSQTLEFDLHVYFVQDLMKKWSPWKNNPAKAWGQMIDTDKPIPPEIANDATKKIVHTAEDTALVVDLGHADVQGVINQHTSRWKYVARMADSICERRILSKFIPIGKLVPSSDGRFYVPIVSWSDCERDYEQWRELAIAAADGDSEQMIEGEAVEVQAETAAPSAEEFEQGMVDDIDEDTGERVDMPATPGVSVPPQPAREMPPWTVGEPPPAKPAVATGPTTEAQQSEAVAADSPPKATEKVSVEDLQERIKTKIQRIDFGTAEDIVKKVTDGKANAGNAAEIIHEPTLVKIDEFLTLQIEAAKQAKQPERVEGEQKPPGAMF